jgi:protein YIPF6
MIYINYRCVAINSLESAGDAFVQVFLLFWLGSYMININTRKLGLNSTLFQSVCSLGYSMFPLNIVAFISLFIGRILFIKILLVVAATVWSIKCK